MATVNDIFISLFPTKQKRLLEPPGSLFLFSFTNVKQSLRCRSVVDRNITHHLEHQVLNQKEFHFL